MDKHGHETEQEEMERTMALGEAHSGAPGGARQNVRRDTEQGAVSRPGGAAQNSGGALGSNADEMGDGPGRGAD
ncbi:MAG TPA: hypothetical protein VFN38_10805 [Gemmatimonadaceae bacterium]|nr:hypothetical protein [Gemmatimonadaceae bacterium]